MQALMFATTGRHTVYSTLNTTPSPSLEMAMSLEWTEGVSSICVRFE